MSAWLTKETADIKAFLEGRDVYQEAANSIGNISRDTGKTVRHQMKYGSGVDRLCETLSRLPRKEVERVYEAMKEKYRLTFMYAKDLETERECTTPIYGRRILFNEHKPYTNFN